MVSLSSQRVHQLWQAKFSTHTQIWQTQIPSIGHWRVAVNLCSPRKSFFPLELSSFDMCASTTLQIIQFFLVVFMGAMFCQKLLHSNWKWNCFFLSYGELSESIVEKSMPDSSGVDTRLWVCSCLQILEETHSRLINMAVLSLLMCPLDLVTCNYSGRKQSGLL